MSFFKHSNLFLVGTLFPKTYQFVKSDEREIKTINSIWVYYNILKNGLEYTGVTLKFLEDGK